METPLKIEGVTVAVSEDAGGYYCGLTFYCCARWALTHNSSILRGPDGALLGFLHIPDDPDSYGEPGQGDRHLESRILLTRTVARWHRLGATRILISGFGPFRGIVNNPSGDLVQSTPDISRVVHRATGLDPSREEPMELGIWGHVSHYTGLKLARVVLQTSDACIDPTDPRSIQSAISAFRPHAVLMMGVIADGDVIDRTFRIETRACDRNLDVSAHCLTDAPESANLTCGALLEAMRHRDAPEAHST